MTSNVPISSNIPSTKDTAPFYLYIIEGSIITVFSTAMTLIILLTPKFFRQKEYMLLAFNVMFDAFFGLQYLLSGIHYLTVAVSNEFVPLVPRLACYSRVSVLLMIFVIPGMGLMAMANALDRLFMITFIGKYKKFGLFYPICIFGVVLLCCLPTTITALITVLAAPYELVQGNCLVRSAIPNWLYIVLRSIRIMTTLIAALLYLPILIKIRKTLKSSGAIEGTQRKQFKLTSTIAFITKNCHITVQS
uniref:G_PROTEIN_RECEP_F1_2 domain-containing protein n=1 Tax=Panagrellus redivivus TaxID=6233 RepID=A0A7E4VVA9_PANRE